MKLFTKHPHERGMSYFGHLLGAGRLSYVLGKGCAGIFIHAIFPFLFDKIASDTLKELDRCLNPAKPTSPQL